MKTSSKAPPHPGYPSQLIFLPSLFRESVCEKSFFDRLHLFTPSKKKKKRAINRRILFNDIVSRIIEKRGSKEETIGSVSNFAASRSIERGNQTDAMLHVVERLLEIGCKRRWKKSRDRVNLVKRNEISPLEQGNFRSAIKVRRLVLVFFFLSFFFFPINCREKDRRCGETEERRIFWNVPLEQTFVNFDDNRR